MYRITGSARNNPRMLAVCGSCLISSGHNAPETWPRARRAGAIPLLGTG